MTWKNPAQIAAPQQTDFPTLGDFILAYTVHEDVVNFADKFLAAKPDPQYASPQAYIASLVQYAVNLSMFSSVFATPNPTLSGVEAAMAGISLLSQIAVNPADPNTVSVLTAWENGTGQLYGGHPPIPAAPAAGGTAATGQGSAPPNSIL